MQGILDIDRLKMYFPVMGGVIRSKPIGWIKAVDDVSFIVTKGETFGLVGESGCGKSTIAKLILLLENPIAGRVLFRDKDIFGLSGNKLSEYRSSVQAVFQDPTSSLNPRMKIEDIIIEPLIINHKLKKAAVNQRLNDVLTDVGIDPAARSRYPHEFSGGQRQRIALARALIVRPDLIIMDEPVSALDVSIQAQILNLLKMLQEKMRLTFLFIAHGLGTVRYMSSNIGVMYLGKLVEQGPAEEVFERRLHPYTQALISASLPSHPDIRKEKMTLSGEVPSALSVPSGCRFHPRCPHSMDICSKVQPDLEEIESGHWVACHLGEN